jgi:hypothetical protein
LHYYKVGTLVTSSATTSFSLRAFLLVAGIFDESNLIFSSNTYTNVGRDSSVGIATGYELDGPGIEKKNPGEGEILRTRPDPPWGSPSLLYSEYRVFSGVKLPGRYADHPSAEVTRG